MVNLFCPNCQAQNECPDETAGAVVNCRKCGHGISIAAPAATLNLPPEPGAETASRSGVRGPAPTLNLPPEPGAEGISQSRASGPAPTLDLPPEPDTEVPPAAAPAAETTRTTADRST